MQAGVVSLRARVLFVLAEVASSFPLFEEASSSGSLATFCAILFILDPIAILVVQVALINHAKSFAAAVARGSQERIVDGSLRGAKHPEVDLTKLVEALVCQHTVPMSH